MILKRQIYFHSPPQNNIIVFDRANSHYITDFILKDEPCFIFDVRPEKIYVSPEVLFYFFLSFHSFSWGEIIKRKGLSRLRDVLQQLRRVYILSCFKCIKPKVVITFIDNSTIFHWLVRNYKKARFLAVENGHRTKWEIGSGKKFYHQYLFCFGDYGKHRYVQFGHVVDECYPAGSLLAGYYRANVKHRREQKYDLAIVSQYTSEGFKLYSDSKLRGLHWTQRLIRGKSKLYKINLDKQKKLGVHMVRMSAINLMNTFLVKYISECNLTAAVLMRGRGVSKSGEERKYYEEKFGENVILIDRNVENMSSYCAADESELVVGFNSTLLIEAFGLGRKVIFIDFTGTDLWNDYDPMVMFTEPDYSLFKKRLNELRNEPYDVYRKRTREYARYLMNYIQNCPAHVFIRQKVLQYL